MDRVDNASRISGLTPGRIVDAASATTVETAATINTDQTIQSDGLLAPYLRSDTSAGVLIENTSGGDVALFGAGGGQGVTFYDGVIFDAETASRIVTLGGSKEVDTPAAISTAQTLAITNTTDSSSKDTGCVVLEGGLGVEKAVTVGTTLRVGSLITVSSPAGGGNPGAVVQVNNQSNGVTDPDIGILNSGASANSRAGFLVASHPSNWALLFGNVVAFGASTAGSSYGGTADAGKVAFYAQGSSVSRMLLGCYANAPLDLMTNNTVRLSFAAGGDATFSSTTDSASKDTGSIVTDGGVGVEKSLYAGNSILSVGATHGIGYATGAGGTVTQITSRTTGVTLNKVCGAITLVSAAGSATWQSFTVTNSAVATTDTIIVNQDSGTDKYMIHVTAVGAGSFEITYATTGGTTSEQPVFKFAVIKAVTA